MVNVNVVFLAFFLAFTVHGTPMLLTLYFKFGKYAFIFLFLLILYLYLDKEMEVIRFLKSLIILINLSIYIFDVQYDILFWSKFKYNY